MLSLTHGVGEIAMPEQARCPKCNRRSDTPYGERGFYCYSCRLGFEPEDDGLIGYSRPAVNAERNERRELRGKAGKG